MAKDITVTIDKTVLDKIRRTAPQKAGIGLRKMAFDGERDWKQSLGTSPSSPGDPPGVVTGAMRASIHTEKLGAFSYQIVTGLDYPMYLEFGTSKMAARPSAMPMALRLQKAVDTYFKNIVD